MAVFIIPGFWGKKEFYKPLAEAVTNAGFETAIIDLGRNTRGVRVAAETVLAYLQKTAIEDDIIAHSFGGIVMKHIMYHYPEMLTLLNSISFVAVPHGGSWYALLLSMFPTARDLLPIRDHIKELAHVQLPEATMNFVAASELKIWPRRHALLPGYIDMVIPGTNHDNIINNPEFMAKVITFIKSRHDRISLTK